MLLVAILAAHALLAWQLRARDIFTFGDDAAYLLLGRALRSLSYRELQFVGQPIAARFPPGYPAVLAVSGALFGERLGVIAMLGIAFSVSGIWALFDVVRHRWSTSTALVAAALVAINPALLEFEALPASEMMFLSLTLWSLWAADRWERRPAGGGGVTPGRPFAGVTSIVLAVLAAMTRSAGVTLPMALIAHWVWRRRWRTAIAMMLVTGVVVGGWLAWTTLAPRRDVRLSYIDDVVRPVGASESFAAMMTRRVTSNVPTYVTQVSLTQLPVPVTPRTVVDNVGWVLALGGLFLVGLVQAWKRWNAAALYVVAYCGLLAVWPYLLVRFLVPMLPLVLTFMAIGAAVVGARVTRRPDWMVAAVGAMLAAFALRADFDLVGRMLDCDRSRADCTWATSLDFVDAARLARKLTPPTARFVAPKGATLYYHGDRQAVFWEEAVRQDSTTFLPYMRRAGVTHILATPVYGDYETILRLVERSCTRFSLVHAISPHTLILAFNDAPGTSADGERTCFYVRRALASAHVVSTA